MDRRRFLLTSLAGALAVPLSGEAQPAKTPRIGYLGPTSASSSAHLLESFRQGLRELGYVEGQSIFVDYRWADGMPDRFPALAAELIQLRVDAIVTYNNAAVAAVQRATRTVPIVAANMGDPVGSGFVASLARPGGNITGFAGLAEELGRKWAALLVEAAPKVSRIGVLAVSRDPAQHAIWVAIQDGIKTLKVSSQRQEVAGPDEIDHAFASFVTGRAQGLIVPPHAVTNARRAQLVGLAAKHRLAGLYPDPQYVEAGGLMSYGANYSDLHRRAATVVDKILRGARPADLPVNGRRSSSSSSTPRPPKPSVSRSRPRCWRGRIRSSNERTGKTMTQESATHKTEKMSLFPMEIQVGGRFTRRYEWGSRGAADIVRGATRSSIRIAHVTGTTFAREYPAQTLIVRTRRMKLLGILLLSFACVAAVVWNLARQAPTNQGLSEWLRTIAFFIVTAWISLWTLRECLDRRPRIVIDDHGVVDRFLGVGLIPWSDIVSAHLADPIPVYSLTGKRVKSGWFDFRGIALTLRDPGQWREKFATARPLSAMLSRMSETWEFNLSFVWTDVDVEEVLIAIRRRIEERGVPEQRMQ